MGLYLANSGDKCKFDGVSLFATPFDVEKGGDHFYVKAWLSSWVIGSFLNDTIYQNAFPKLKELTDEKEAARMEHVLKTNNNGLRTLDEQFYTQMYGFENV